MSAILEGIFIVETKAGRPRALERVQAIAGAGLAGDRYGLRQGTFTPKPGASPKPGRQLTLIEAEAIERLAARDGIALGPGESRRNLVTRGVALNDLVGKRFRIGAVECLGIELCDPCGHLEKLTRAGVKQGLHNAGGLRADIVTGGELAVGDPIEEI